MRQRRLSDTTVKEFGVETQQRGKGEVRFESGLLIIVRSSLMAPSQPFSICKSRSLWCHDMLAGG
jgi:hypothetical protein